MSEAGELVHILRNLPVGELITALERDGFTLRRSTRTGGRIYMHKDGRLTVVHYHHGSDTYGGPICQDNILNKLSYTLGAEVIHFGREKSRLFFLPDYAAR